jgi:transcriptional regulator with XRE-family HTH domain
VDLGKRIHELRTEKRLTLEELANRAGLTASFISQLERSIVFPSIPSLSNIASALGVKTDFFFKQPEVPKGKIIKKEKRERFILKDEGADVEVLSESSLGVKMQPLIFTLKVGGHTGNQLNPHEGEEFGMVLKGGIELSVGKDKYMMEEGDSISFNSIQPHKFVNIGREEAIILWVVFSPRGVM